MPIPDSLAVLNDDLRDILGRPCFACIDVAKVLRLNGQIIDSRAEAEQAAVIHWTLGLYLEHGPEWKAKGDEFLRRIVDRARKAEALAKEGQSDL